MAKKKNKSKTTKEIRAIDTWIKFQLDDGIQSLTIKGKDALGDLIVDKKGNVELFLNADKDKVNDIISQVPFLTVTPATTKSETNPAKTMTIDYDLTEFALELASARGIAELIKTKTTLTIDFSALKEALNNISKRLTSVETKNAEQDDKLAELESKNAEQDSKLNEIENENIVQNNKLNELVNKNTEQDNKLTELETKYGEHEEAINDQALKLSELENKNNEQDMRLEKIENKPSANINDELEQIKRDIQGINQEFEPINTDLGRLDTEIKKLQSKEQLSPDDFDNLLNNNQSFISHENSIQEMDREIEKLKNEKPYLVEEYYRGTEKKLYHRKLIQEIKPSENRITVTSVTSDDLGETEETRQIQANRILSVKYAIPAQTNQILVKVMFSNNSKMELINLHKYFYGTISESPETVVIKGGSSNFLEIEFKDAEKFKEYDRVIFDIDVYSERQGDLNFIMAEFAGQE